MSVRHVRRVLFAITIFALALPLLAERGDDSKRASKNGMTAGSIDGVAIEIEYGRPKVKGRELWGKLVPYGKVWRTGADEATTISFSDDVKIEGERLAAGTYALFTVPGESSWQIVFNKVAKQWGAFGYKESEDALRVTVEPSATDHTEELTFAIEGDRVVLRWGELEVGFRVEKA